MENTLAERKVVSFSPKTELYSYEDISLRLSIYFDSVSSPDEQTHLLAETLIKHVLPELDNNSICIDVGSGAGLHAVLLAKYSKEHKKNLKVIALDYSEKAVISTLENVLDNDVSDTVSVLQSNLYNKLLSESALEDGCINAVSEFKSNGNRANLIYANPPMMPTCVGSIVDFTDEVIGNFDYVKASRIAEYTDGLGVIKNIIERGESLLVDSGILMLVTAGFLDEKKIKDIFEENGFDFYVVEEKNRKVRPGGFTWKNMEVIEDICGYQFYGDDGVIFDSIENAKRIGANIYHKIKVFKGVLTARTNRIPFLNTFNPEY